MKAPAFMIVPSLACQASCRYCFGPHKGAIMDERTARETVQFIHDIAMQTATKEINIIFHGGEPLLAPLAVWVAFFDEIKTVLSDYQLRLNMQSNLWKLDDDYLKLLVENNVSIGTSIDGPKHICDLNRGEGYYDKTISSIKKANAAGCSVSGIATVTRQTLPYMEEIVKYFRNNGMPMVLHGAVSGIDNAQFDFSLTPKEYAGMVKGLFPWYIKNRKHIKIDTLDHYVKGIVWGQPEVCTLRDCLGMFLAISPIGDIFSCQRLTGRKEYCMGSVFDHPSLEQLYESPAAKAQRQREKEAKEKCSDCNKYPICKGGCYYNAISSSNGVIDPLCEAYKEIYDFVNNRIMEEMQSEENIAALKSPVSSPADHPFFRKGKYISLSQKTHPARIAENARYILSLHELSKTNDPHTAATNLFAEKICGDVTMTTKILENIKANLYNTKQDLNNCYIYVTLDCNLRCTHCYAEGGKSREEMDVLSIEKLIKEAIENKFRQVIIVGGEPLIHSRRKEMLNAIIKYKGQGVNIVLRTNLTGNFEDEDFRILAKAFDQVVASVDGNEQTHDARRGKGTYKNLTHNLEEYARISSGIPDAAELSLACVMAAKDINGEPGQSVNALGRHLGVKRVRFRPLLPLGRASRLDEPVMCEGLMQHISPGEMLKTKLRPLTTCGIGQNILINPDGRSYPCYAWCGEHTFIGNVIEEGLGVVMASPKFRRLSECNVDTIEKCKDCSYRYFCGGACRAWGNQQQLNLNAAPPQCDHLKERAEKIIKEAREFLSLQNNN